MKVFHLVEGSEFPHLSHGERILWSVSGVKIRDDEGRETEEGNIYVTNLRLIFHGKMASFSKNLKKGGKGVTALSLFLENISNAKALDETKELEIEYYVDESLSGLSCGRVFLSGLTEVQIGRLILLVEEFKKGTRPALKGLEGEKEKKAKGTLSRILEIINPDEGKGRSKEKQSRKRETLRASVSSGGKSVAKEDEELLKIPPGLEVEGEVELICPACGEWIKWRPGMLVCPACNKKMNPFTGKVVG
ncbi:MAG: hypothetical protein QXK94_09080 [Candidatus Jordarchaeales archaeon]